MNQDFIEIINARENNLKNISIKIPKGKITIFTGVSGSGKSSIVFDTIAQEAGRQLNETYSSFVRLFLPRYSRPEADEFRNRSTAIVVDQKRLGGNARSTLGTITDINSLLRLLFSRFGQPHIGYSNAYSFNDPIGMCPKCEGIGKIIALNADAALDKEKSLNESANTPASVEAGVLAIPVQSEMFQQHNISQKEVNCMPIVFLDERISIHSNINTGTTLVDTTALLIGDIGLQTFSVANTPNAADVRIALAGTVNLLGEVELFTTITLTIERNSTGIAGTGTLIYTEVYETDGSDSLSPLSITTGDFPPAVAVNAGQIRYSLFVSSTLEITMNGPVGFNGSAVAGTT
ncbi:MAG: daunorubicin resistance protein DrrC [Paenibacillaceae bacterium]|nr:daunorubicin resistance protein DrrC [Paenibacillaceae bacterium]